MLIQTKNRLTKTMVEVFFHGSRVPPINGFPGRFVIWLYSQNICRLNTVNISPTTQYTSVVVKAFLSSGREPEQGYKSCASLTRLGDKYGLDRLEKVCERVIAYSVQSSIRNISTVLKNRQDKLASAPSDVPKPPKSHGIIRGAASFQRGTQQ